MRETNKKIKSMGRVILIFLLLGFMGCGEKSHKAWYNKGIALDDLGRYEEAIKAYDKAIELKPDYQKAWYNKGIALRKLYSYEEALEAFNKAIEIKPDDHDAWNNKGIALKKLGRYE